MSKEKKYAIVDPTTLRLVNPKAHWRDKMLVAEFHGKTFTKEQAGEFLANECKRRGNSENTVNFVKTQPFNWNLKHGIIINVNSAQAAGRASRFLKSKTTKTLLSIDA